MDTLVAQTIMNRRFSNPVRGRFNAWILHISDNTGHKTFGKRKQKIFENLPDSIVELGPGGGQEGGYMVFQGNPESIVDAPDSLTGIYLKKNLKNT